MRHALWIDIREPGSQQRQLVFDAEPPNNKRLRLRRLQELVAELWPAAELIDYSGGVGGFRVGRAWAVAYFAHVRDGTPLLPIAAGVL